LSSMILSLVSFYFLSFGLEIGKSSSLGSPRKVKLILTWSWKWTTPARDIDTCMYVIVRHYFFNTGKTLNPYSYLKNHVSQLGESRARYSTKFSLRLQHYKAYEK
jgi:hypothetical protein